MSLVKLSLWPGGHAAASCWEERGGPSHGTLFQQGGPPSSHLGAMLQLPTWNSEVGGAIGPCSSCQEE